MTDLAQPEGRPAPLHGHNIGGDWIECTDEHPAAQPPAVTRPGTEHRDEMIRYLEARQREHTEEPGRNGADRSWWVCMPVSDADLWNRVYREAEARRDSAGLDVDERNWLAGEGTIAAAMAGERLMARDPIIKAAYERGRDDGVNFGRLSGSEGDK